MVFKIKMYEVFMYVWNALREMSIPLRMENFGQGRQSRVNMYHFQYIQIFAAV